MIRKLRLSLQQSLRRSGVELRKVPPRFEQLPVFDLAVQFLMASRGEQLSFVQVGANNGIDGDPLRAYILKRGWRGVLVEPQPNVFAELIANYAGHEDRLKFENVAISCGESLVLYRPPADWPVGADGSTYVSGVPHVLAKQLGVPEGALTRIEVPALTLDGLLAKHAITQLDLLQIDAEGYDWQVLRSIDLSRVAPALIQIETGHLARPDLAKVGEYLTDAGYDLCYTGRGADTIAMLRGTIPTA